jgi:hypothetical protein
MNILTFPVVIVVRSADYKLLLSVTCIPGSLYHVLSGFMMLYLRLAMQTLKPFEKPELVFIKTSLSTLYISRLAFEEPRSSYIKTFSNL